MEHLRYRHLNVIFYTFLFAFKAKIHNIPKGKLAQLNFIQKWYEYLELSCFALMMKVSLDSKI